ncbi:hypothetical protein K3495_g14662 [Podosphaera aphanis]|nr:hypothetical protein K3495_g14662 [Podosphaera aphanis]
MYIENNGPKPVLHIIDEATRFQAARWLKDISSQTVWNTLRACWIDTYLGPPDIVSHDAGTQFVSNEFRQLANSMAITTEPVPIEAHNSIGIVERYHLPLRRAYEIIAEELEGSGCGVDREMLLQMAIKSVNDTAGPNGLVPTLLVFGAYPRMSKLDPPTPSILQRAKAIEKAMIEVTRLRNNRQIQDALRQRNGPQVDHMKSLPINSKVWVWRERKGWTGPHYLESIDGQTCTVRLPNGPSKFRITVVKPYLDESDKDIPDSQENEPISLASASAINNEEPEIRRNPDRHRQLPERYRQNFVITTFLSQKEELDQELSKKLRAEKIITDPNLPFFLSRQKEINGLISKGVFEIVTDSSGVRI